MPVPGLDPGIVAGIHALLCWNEEGVDGRDKPGHDAEGVAGHPRLALVDEEGVDGRDEPGHDAQSVAGATPPVKAAGSCGFAATFLELHAGPAGAGIVAADLG